jgi:hypothetical protein
VRKGMKRFNLNVFEVQSLASRPALKFQVFIIRQTQYFFFLKFLGNQHDGRRFPATGNTVKYDIEFFQFISNFGIIQSNTSNSPMSLNVFALEEKHLLKGKTKEKTTFSDVQYISTVTSNRYCLGLLDGFVILSHTGEVLVREKTKQGVSVIETMENCDTVAIVGNGKEFWEFKRRQMMIQALRLKTSRMKTSKK